MELILASVYGHEGCTLKDVAGGFGTVFEVGRSWQARLLEHAKSHLAELPPVVLGHLAASLRGLGHRVQICEVRGRVDEASLFRADAVLVHTSLVDAHAERDLMRRLRSVGVRVVAFGAAATALPTTFAEDADVVLVGEPEGLPAARWASVLAGAERGVLDAGQVADLDALPLPDWRGFPIERYRYALLTRRGPTLPIQSARGCPYGCGYCPWRVTAAFRERDPDAVVREARHDRDVFGARALSFRDPLFNLDRDRVLALARGLAPLGLRWSAEMRADRIDRELLEVMRRAGLRSLELGVESVNRTLLARQRRKPPTLAQIETVVRDATALGIRVICNYVLGLPGDSEESMRDTIAWAKQLNSFAVQFTVATPYPGTSLARNRGLPVLDAPSPMTGFRPSALEGSIRPERLAELREWAYVSYHFRPRYVARFLRQAARSLFD
ncbi:MAG: hypothetical protein OHK0013_37060 [Sandaracinaceae bacterium]